MGVYADVCVGGGVDVCAHACVCVHVHVCDRMCGLCVHVNLSERIYACMCVVVCVCLCCVYVSERSCTNQCPNKAFLPTVCPVLQHEKPRKKSLEGIVDIE